MPPKPAKPDRYVVDKVGTPDPPAAEYFVLDLVHDYDARVAGFFLARSYENRNLLQKAAELRQALKDAEPAHKAHCEQLNKRWETKRKKTKGR